MFYSSLNPLLPAQGLAKRCKWIGWMKNCQDILNVFFNGPGDLFKCIYHFLPRPDIHLVWRGTGTQRVSMASHLLLGALLCRAEWLGSDNNLGGAWTQSSPPFLPLLWRPQSVPLPPPCIHWKGFSSIVSRSITVTHTWPLHGTNPVFMNNNQQCNSFLLESLL